MTESDRPTHDIMSVMAASAFMLEVFMLQIALEIGKTKPDPQAWARDFIDELHSRVDANEERTDDRRYPVHELSRAGFDRLGSTLMQLLALPRHQKP